MHGGEWSLIAFTLLTQASVGIQLFSPLLPDPNKSLPYSPIQGRIRWMGMHSLGLLFLFPALAAAFFHLGSPDNAVFALSQFKSSWLSREIAAVLFYGASSLVYFWVRIISRAGSRTITFVWAVTGVFGLILIFSMSAIYLLPAVPAWNFWTTPVLFLLSALLLGGWITLRNIAFEGNSRKTLSPDPKLQVNSGKESPLKMLAGWLVCLAAAGHLAHYLFFQKIKAVFSDLPYEFPVPFITAVMRTVFLLLAFLCLVGAWTRLRRDENRAAGAGIWIYSAGAALIISEIIGRYLFYTVFVRKGL